MVKQKPSRELPVTRSQGGFTLVELMVVISIVMILISVAVPMYLRSIARARDAVLRQDLYSMRQSIDQFTLDKQRAPQSLDELVQENYLGLIPIDPCTNSRDTWVVDQEDVMLAVDQTQPGITNVHSGCPGTAADGTPYSSW
jgi:general secretion pathway protein G